jgi:hypothetical protein
MPRDGSNIYHRPPGTDGIPNTTVASTPYNAYVADVEQDLNLPRPIVAGGTGASSADAALVNLSGETAKQIITNFDSAAWVNGSFYSAAGATSAPNPTNRFAGIYYGNADDSYATVEARDQTTGILYVRKKVAGVWDAVPAGWLQSAGTVADTDARYVNVTGDAMTGSLVIGADSAGYQLKLSSTHAGDPTPDKHLRVNANGSFGIVNSAFSAEILLLSDAGNLSAQGTFTAGNGGATGAYYFGNTGNKYLNYDGTNFNLAGGPLLLTGSLKVNNNANLVALSGISIGSTVAKNAAGTQGIFLQSNDPGASCQYGSIYLITDPTAATRRLAIQSNENGVATRPITLNEGGGNVGVGVANPLYPFHVRAAANINLGMYSNAGALELSTFNDAVNANIPMAIRTTYLTTYGQLQVISGAASAGASATTAINIGYTGGGSMYGISMKPVTDGTTAIYFANAAGGASGAISVTATTTTYSTSSDGRLKEDLKSFDAGRIVDDTNIYSFSWKNMERGAPGSRGYGVIAQEAVEVYPDAITYLENEDWYGVDYSKYVPVLLQELKALRARVAALEGAPTPLPA